MIENKKFKISHSGYKESPDFSVHYGTCRECRNLQQVVKLRGWDVCLYCLEQIDRIFTELRVDTKIFNDGTKF